jgi:hypothetical protein
MDHRRWTVSVLLALTAVAGCGRQAQEDAVPRPDIMTVVDVHAPQLMEIAGVTAVAVGATDSGDPCVRIYVETLTDDLRARLPATLEGWPVEVRESGEIKPLGD